MKTQTQLTLDQQVGQRLLVGFDGTAFDDELKYLIGTLKVGGLILFSQNITSPEQVKKLCGAAQSYAASCGLPPLFVSVDQEGGLVARMKEPLTLFPQGASGIDTPHGAEHFGSVTAKELSACGYNMDMAPVLDVQPQGFSGIMEGRAFPGDAHSVGSLGVHVMEALHQGGVLPVVKHFPGIGRTTLDSHLTLPELETPLNEMRETDLLPFAMAFDAEAPAVMLSHVRYTGIDATWPASLSSEVVKGLLRGQMGFNGVVMTDDLDMKAITCDMETAARQIFFADVDIALICHRSPRYEALFSTLKTLAETYPSAHALSVGRILALKKEMARLKGGA